MLGTASMSRTALALVLVAASASAASAGTYLGAGIGTAPAVNTDFADMQSSGRSGRLVAGMRFGRLSVEGSGGRYGLYLAGAPFDSTTLAADVKFSLPLGSNFEAYGKAGLQNTWLSTDAMGYGDTSGGGLLLGAGFEYRLNLVATSASLFVDYQYAHSSFDTDNKTPFDASARMWTLGFTVGL